MTEILGLPIKYSNPEPKNFVNKMVKEYGFPEEYAKVMKMIYFIVRKGLANKIFPDAEEILGRKPRLIDEYIKDYSSKWH